MQPHSNIFIGIDVSKDELVIAYLLDNKWIKCKVANHVADYLKLVKQDGCFRQAFCAGSHWPL